MISKRTTIKYLIYTFLLSYISWGSIIIANQFGYLKYGTPVSMVLFMIGGLSPTVISYLLLRHSGVFPNFKSFIKEIFAFKQLLTHYLIVIVFVVLYFGVPALMNGININMPFYMSILLIPLMLLGGGLEELGWRYVLQPALEEKLPFVIATLFTACIWTVWHLPLFFISGATQYGTSYIVFGISVFGLSFALAAIFRVGKSIWLCILFHSMVNAFWESFARKDDIVIVAVTTIIIIITATALASYSKYFKARTV